MVVVDGVVGTGFHGVATGPGPWFHNTLVGRTTPLGKLAVRIFGFDPQIAVATAHAAHHSTLTEGILQVVVGVPVYVVAGVLPEGERNLAFGLFYSGYGIGWLIGSVLLVNLLAAHAVRFKMNWKRSGILMLHAGVIILMLSELITGLFAIEGNMTIEQNGSSNFLEHRDTTAGPVLN